jgi:uncharacterized protein YndB with AHSA1/START domain
MLNAPANKVWKALTVYSEMKKWYFDLPEFRAEIGVKFQFEGGPSPDNLFLHLCEVVKVEEERKLSYTWRYDGYPGISKVTFELFPAGTGTRLKLTHEGLESFPEGKPEFAKNNFKTGWTQIIGTSLVNFLNNKT